MKLFYPRKVSNNSNFRNDNTFYYFLINFHFALLSLAFPSFFMCHSGKQLAPSSLAAPRQLLQSRLVEKFAPQTFFTFNLLFFSFVNFSNPLYVFSPLTEPHFCCYVLSQIRTRFYDFVQKTLTKFQISIRIIEQKYSRFFSFFMLPFKK